MLKPKGAFAHAAAVASMGLASMMIAMQRDVPAFAARATPTFVRAPEYDGLGRKKRVVSHPSHSRKRRSKAWRDYAERVRLTHPVDAFGNRRIDPRDDKYLHSHARVMRRLQRSLAA